MKHRRFCCPIILVTPYTSHKLSLAHNPTTWHPEVPVKRARVFFSAGVPSTRDFVFERDGVESASRAEGSAPLPFLRPQAEERCFISAHTIESLEFLRGIPIRIETIMASVRVTKILTVLIVFFCLAGVVDASLALGEHYNTGTSPCDINTKWDCGEVNHSPYAVMRGVPVAIIGIVGYALLGVLAGRFPWITAIAALAAVIFSLRLTNIEWKDLKVWCIYCVISQSIIVIIFLLSVLAAWLSKRKPVSSATPLAQKN